MINQTAIERDFIEKIIELKKEKGYTILAHNYQIGELQDIADITGDSLQLARLATEIENDKILFLGVDFMAETLKILNPSKKIIVPTKGSTCPMANSLTPEIIKEFKEKYPEAPVVLYVNSTAACKVYADYTCTSANAVDVVSKIDSDIVLFGPDKNLGSYVAEKTGKKVIPIPGDTGYCYVHNRFSAEDVKKVREEHPDAKIIIHPESPKEARDLCDYIGSTGQMMKFPETDDAKEFIIGTEVGMIHKLENTFKDKKFYPLKELAICNNMKKNNLKNVYLSLLNEEHEIELPEEIMEKAKIPILNMFKIME
ncbi:quinolinate synthase A [Marinitoga sp. 1135]|uniref:Quinolinate synthase n=1 Tax=Marinitoga piezophila (strain DSM 14283 / JCM 11233 / KA3) TaxID=443254 RepID=H2J309_MARPK|nr:MULTISPECIES: quinolinate synthase NadA [Marinitoga]AEX85700.1 quinolinate synthetase complex, A subunit [Marinitoga piezophila KA3]APT76152.1 quinolinate synthase A [Marinitoga sp. 1137]NUU95904.1 quinolinate synthase A [Marinitoga sp. 1135]NUU97815.1 quinolinate synthase A [Marinitoga sp. 1138]